MIINISNIVGDGELYLSIMNIICGDVFDKSMIDLCCHKAPYTSRLGFKQRTYIDILNRGLDDSGEQDKFVQSDVIDFLKKTDDRYDVSICSDGIEHFLEKDGYELISLMESVSDKQIIFTPFGEVMMNIYLDNNYDTHKSGWTPDMLPNYLAIVLPNFHPSLDSGAWFAVNCDDIEKERIIKQINQQYEQN